MSTIGEHITDLNSTQLGLLKVSDFIDYDVQMDEAERRQYVSTISGVMEILRKELRHAEIAQLRHIAGDAQNWEQVLIARGTINACAVLLERWEAMNTEHMVNIKPKEVPGRDFDQHSPIAE